MKIDSMVLVLRRQFVAQAYPGGTQGFAGDQVARHGAPHCVRIDGELLAITGSDVESLAATSELMRALRVTDASDSADEPCVLVDPANGPLSPCTWLSCSIEGDGTASLAFASVPSPSAPNLFKLSDDGRITTWLHLETGQELTSESQASPETVDASAAAGARTSLLDAAAQAASDREWDCDRDDVEGTLMFGLIAGPLLALDLTCVVRDSIDPIMLLLVRLPGRVQMERIAAVAEYLAGANWGTEVGSFDIDLSDGEVIFRTPILTSDGVVSSKVVEMAVDRSMCSVTHYASGLIDVAAGAEPREVLARVDEK